MTRWAAGAILLIALAAACSDEPTFGAVEDLVVQGPAGRLGDSEALEIVTYQQAFDGRAQACWGLRTEGVEMTPYDHPGLDAKVFGFSIPDTETVTQLVAVSESGDVLGSLDDLP